MAVASVFSHDGHARPVSLGRGVRRLKSPSVSEPAQTLDLQILELVDWMIHELATPLASLTISAEVLSSGFETMPPEEAREALRRIHRNTFWLKALVENFKQSVRVNRAEPRLTLVDLNACVATACSLIEPIVDSRQQTILMGGILDRPIVWGDARWIEHILVNLLMNASKYSGMGSAIWLDLIEDGDTIQVRVIDSGPGIRLQDQARIFRPYTRLNTAQRGRAGGMGLGLHVVKSLVEAQGGSVGVQSAPGRGSTFWFALSSYRHDEAPTSLPATFAGREVTTQLV